MGSRQREKQMQKFCGERERAVFIWKEQKELYVAKSQVSQEEELSCEVAEVHSSIQPFIQYLLSSGTTTVVR